MATKAKYVEDQGVQQSGVQKEVSYADVIKHATNRHQVQQFANVVNEKLDGY